MILAKNTRREEDICVKVLLDLWLFSKSPFNWNLCEDGTFPHADFAHVWVSKLVIEFALANRKLIGYSKSER